jgi:hypothetical protein
MYITTDLLGRSEIRDGNAVVGGEPTANFFTALSASELSHLIDLNTKFFAAVNESVATGKTFKTPLKNTDIAWLYKMVEKEDKVWGVDKYSRPFLKDIDAAVAALRRKNIPISG